MKLKIQFFYDLYVCLTDSNLQTLNLTFDEACFLLQNIHILELPYLDSKKVVLIKNYLQLHFQNIVKFPISVPKYEYTKVLNKFLNASVLIKTLNAQITGFDSNIIFKHYNPEELENLKEKCLKISNIKLVKEVGDIFEFMNEFLGIEYEKINYFLLELLSKCSDENADINDVVALLNNEIEIKLNDYYIVNNCLDFNSFISCDKIIFNRFLVKYKFESSGLKYEHLKLFLDVCQGNPSFVNLLISDVNFLSLKEKVNIITCVLEKYENSPSYICHITTQLFNIYKYQTRTNTLEKVINLLDQYKGLPIHWCNYEEIKYDQYDDIFNPLGDLVHYVSQND